MSTGLGSALLLGGALLWWLWQPPIPDSGFFYDLREGDQIWRVQGTFQSSRVKDTEIRTVEGGFPRFSVWVAITPANAVKEEPRGICFFDDDGDFSGFLRLSPDLSGGIESVRKTPEGTFAVKHFGSPRELRFPEEEANISWPSTGCETRRKE